MFQSKLFQYLKIIILLIVFIFILSSCAHTLSAPLTALKKSESKHTIHLYGYQYQRGLSDDFEFGVDLNLVNPGLNFRYHLFNQERSLHSIQIGFGYGGIVPKTGIKANYKYTYKTNLDTYIRLGPVFSYMYENKDFNDSFDFDTGKKTYKTCRMGISCTYGGKNLWCTLGYSIPIYKNYSNIGWNLFSDSGTKRLLYWHPIYSIDLKFGYSF